MRGYLVGLDTVLDFKGVLTMTKKDRMKELIEVFTDADMRNGLSEEQMKYCPDDLLEVYEIMAS